MNRDKSIGKRCVEVSFRMATCALWPGTVHVDVMGDDRGRLKESLENELESFGSGDTFPNLFFSSRQNHLYKT